MTEEIRKIKDIIEPIFQEAGLTYGALFGSVARGEARADSDIDILYDRPADLPFSIFKLLDLKYQLEAKLGHEVDLVRRNNLKPRVESYVNQDLIVLYEKR